MDTNVHLTSPTEADRRWARNCGLEDQGPEFAADYRNWRVRCVGTARHTGEQCKNWAIKGATCCKWHGGSLPSVQKAAARRMERMKLTGENILIELMQPWHADMVRASAAHKLLKASGLLPKRRSRPGKPEDIDALIAKAQAVVNVGTPQPGPQNRA